ALALVVTRIEAVSLWIAAVATLLLLPGLLYGASVIMLGVVGAGAIALGVLTALVVALLLPLLATVVGDVRHLGAMWLGATALVWRAGAHRVDRRSCHRHNAFSASLTGVADAILGGARQRRDCRALDSRRREDRLRVDLTDLRHPGDSRSSHSVPATSCRSDR